MNLSSESAWVRCGGCGQPVLVTAEVVERHPTCDCGAELDVEAHAELVAMRESRRAAEREQREQKRREHEARAAQREKEKTVAHRQRQAREAHEERLRQARAAAAAREQMERDMQYRASLKVSGAGTIGVSIVLWILAGLAVLLAIGLFSAAQSAIHEIEAFVCCLIAAVLFASGMIGISLASLAARLALKIDAVRDVLFLMEARPQGRPAAPAPGAFPVEVIGPGGGGGEISEPAAAERQATP